jgi:general secretion pathway protein G
MKRSFSLLEVIIVIVVLTIILSFAIPKFTNTLSLSNTTNLKSNIAHIRNSISKLKSELILLGKVASVLELDNAAVDTKDEKLFSKLIDLNIISTNSTLKESGSWNKSTTTTYEYFITSTKKVEFSLENSNFICKSSFEICKEIE